LARPRSVAAAQQKHLNELMDELRAQRLAAAQQAAVQQQRSVKKMAKPTTQSEPITHQSCIDKAAELLSDCADGDIAIDEVEILAKLWIALAQEIRTATYQSEAEFERIRQEILNEQKQ